MQFNFESNHEKVGMNNDHWVFILRKSSLNGSNLRFGTSGGVAWNLYQYNFKYWKLYGFSLKCINILFW